MAKRELWELQSMQSSPLSVKIRLTQQRIREWVDEYGEEGCYISFSGGKDSTVLLDIVRNRCGYKNIPAVYVDTGLEYPEIKEFVKTFDNVEIIRPKLSFKQVVDKYGYPFVSKEVSENIDGARRFLSGEYINKKTGERSYEHFYKKLFGLDEYAKGQPRAPYASIKWRFLIDSPFKISNMCCKVMKKSPSHTYSRQTGRKAITGQMATESRLRTQQWLKNGCNGFNMALPVSNPMSFWTEQDVLLYIKEYQLPICSVYGEVVIENGSKEVEGQLNLSDMGIFDDDKPLLTTTGCKRTGCMFCGYSCHMKNDQRFVNMKETHPQIYDYVFKPESEGGLGYKEKIDWINEHGNLHIQY